MMPHELVIDIDGALLVGGYASPAGFVDATTATDASGHPIIPASTLKGALREALTRMARGSGGGGACDLGDVACGACIVCELLGAPGSEYGEVLAETDIRPGASGRIFIGDARPETADPATLRRSLRTRHGVGIDRALRSVAPEILFEREVLDAPGTRFVAPLRTEGVKEDAWKLFRSSLALVTGIGNSRSRGVGHVRVALRPAPTEAAKSTVHELPEAVPEGGAALVVIEVLEPMVLGGLTPTSNFMETLDFVPGSVLRGALGNVAVARMGGGPAFQEIFVEPTTCLLFSDAYPAPSAKRGEPVVMPVPVPRSSLACKHEERSDHAKEAQRVPLDGLLSAALGSWLVERFGGSLPGHRCSACGKPLGTAHGIWPRPKLVRRVVTRLARDIHLGSAMPGMLYTVTQIEAGAVFVGTVARLSAAALQALRDLADIPLRIGRGRSRGQGLVRLRVVPDEGHLGASAVLRRRARMETSLSETLPLLGALCGLEAGGAVAVLARTDLAIQPSEAPAELLNVIYGADAPRARCAAVVQSAATRSGWNEGKNGDKTGPRTLQPVVRAGSAWLFAHGDGVTLDPRRLACLEVEGVGGLRELGLGRIVFDHELFCAQ